MRETDTKTERNRDIQKATEIGAHILSGNVFETRALDELLPNWRELKLLK